MNHMKRTCASALVAATFLMAAPVAHAQAPAVEMGTTMMNVTVGVGDNNDGTIIGVPSGGFGLLNPGVYASVFAGDYLSIEPQIGLIWVSSEGESNHLLNFTGQVNYFVRGNRQSSPYVFGAAGILDVSESSANPKTYGGGAGYRFLLGDRLVFRADGRYMHFTNNGGNAFMFGISIGGVFSR
jgi:hypothetical protein